MWITDGYNTFQLDTAIGPARQEQIDHPQTVSVVVRGDSLTGFDVSGEADAAEVRVDGVPFPVVDGRFAGRVDLAEPRPWSPADPHLYALEVTTADDLRRVEQLLDRHEP